MKECPKCKINKNVDEFNKNSNRKDGLQRVCRQCSKIEQDNYYKKHYKTHQQKVKNYLSKIKHEEVDLFKQKVGCQKCGDKRWYVLDFHHINPKTKINELSKRLSKGVLLKEREKCVVLCKNCHAEFHHLERQNNITLEKYYKL